MSTSSEDISLSVEEDGFKKDDGGTPPSPERAAAPVVGKAMPASASPAVVHAAARRPWWKSPILWAAVGLVCVAVGLSVGLTLGLNKDDKSSSDAAETTGTDGTGGGTLEASFAPSSALGSEIPTGFPSSVPLTVSPSPSTLFPSSDQTTDMPSSQSTPHPSASPSTDSTPQPDDTTDGVATVQMRSSIIQQEGPLGYTLRTFSAESMEGNADCSVLEDDLKQAMFYVANQIITNSDDYYYPVMPLAEAAADGSDGGNENSGSDQGENQQVDPDGYGTYNQEENVDEADVAKSDGERIYAVLGDRILVWDALTGDKLSVTQLPSNDKNKTSSGGGDGDGDSDTFTTKSIMEDYWYRPRPQIKALLLHDQRLVAVVTGYNPTYSWYYDGSDGCAGEDDFIFTGESTQLRIYNIAPDAIPTDGSPLQLLATKDLRGTYQDSRSIDSAAHVVTISNMDLGCYFYRLSRYHENYAGLTEQEYKDKATEEANAIIPLAVEKIMDELALGNDCRNVMRIAVFLSGELKDEDEEESDELPDITGGRGFLQGYAEVHSFDMSATHTDGMVSTQTSGYFLPESWADIYASQQLLFLLVRSSVYNRVNWSIKESTTLVGVRLFPDGSNAPALAGEVPGYMVNQFAISNSGDYVRIATTNSAQWGRVEKTEDGNTYWTYEQISDNSNQLEILQLPQGWDQDNGNATAPSVGVMTKVGSIDANEGLGKPNERIEGVRFVGDVAFIVTFLRTDPFYTVDVSDPSNPRIVGTLTIPGYSTFLHPMNAEKTLILAVGRNADMEGFDLGLKLVVFDVSDLSNPTQEAQWVPPSNMFDHSYSEAAFEHKAFRFVQFGEEQLLIIPISLQGAKTDTSSSSPSVSPDDFDGFIVFSVSRNEIAPKFNISHIDDTIRSPNFCGYWARLEARSMVFAENVVSMKGLTVQSHNLNTFDLVYAFDVDDGDSKSGDECYGYWMD